MRSLRLLASLLVAVSLSGLSCSPADSGEDDRAPTPPLLGGKGDGPADVELLARLHPGADLAVTGTLSSSTKHGYVFFADEGAVLDLEVTQRGTSRDVDTVLAVWGPRNADGVYTTALGTDDDTGYGALSRMSSWRSPAEGFYVAVVSPKASLAAPKTYRLELRCTSGVCDTDRPVAKQTNDVRWTQLSAERVGLYVQAYGVATQRLDALADAAALPAKWAVVLDIDETVLSNLTYQVERGELGAGYSAIAWTLWVKRREATALPGTLAFLAHVRELGGSIAFVTNRSSAECADTRANLDSESVPYDVVLCRTTTSDKNARFRSVEDGTSGIPAATVVLFVGDNIKDFPALTQDVRFGGEDGYASFLSRFMLVPNPMYGSWETNTP